MQSLKKRFYINDLYCRIMIESKQIRKSFIDFFQQKEHHIVASAPMVIKNDPTLMFTNAGMNQFKDIFLGNRPAQHPRIANSQKCLRVSGKHNDLEEVGHDTYHHTMFEMLGNWSFGNYFKKEAIAWAWEFLTEVMQVDVDRLYVTVFAGEQAEGLAGDDESRSYWKDHIAADRILDGNRKDNFWEMGDTGPCGPCSEVHIDLRDESERLKTDARSLINTSHPQVIEIWNLVFIQFNRKADGSLENLPDKHVDTGMGFERLCMVLQQKQSNYDTDVFTPIIGKIAEITGFNYGSSDKTDIAMRVIADHLRAVSFAIADGQLPSNVKAGYVIRRILRRAVRYYYSVLSCNEPLMCRLVETLSDQMGDYYPELKAQKAFIEKVISEEENTFLHTLDKGIKMLDNLIKEIKKEEYRIVSGKDAFILYDTYGFPFDLTDLIARENGLIVNRKEFEQAMEEQKNRARKASEVDKGDWIQLIEDEIEEFLGYELTETPVQITRYRKINQKGKDLYQLVFNITPFYAESGGQVGDTGYIASETERIEIFDTRYENNTIIHFTEKLPRDLNAVFDAVVDKERRNSTARNHSATHLMHFALREVLGTHVEQKGSLVNPDYLRFDFAHFQKMSAEEIRTVEMRVNQLIRENIDIDEKRDVPLVTARKLGAMALFGEKYGDTVRVIRFGDSVELCGGTHVDSTGNIGFFKIISESAIAAGIRRIEAITGLAAEKLAYAHADTLHEISQELKNPKNIQEAVTHLIDENKQLRNQIEDFKKEGLKQVKSLLKQKVQRGENFSLIAEKVDNCDAGALKDLSYQLKSEIKNLVCILGSVSNDKASLSIMIDEDIVANRNLNAGIIVREAAKAINGGGGGQAFFATAGGSNPEGLHNAIAKAVELLG